MIYCPLCNTFWKPQELRAYQEVSAANQRKRNGIKTEEE